jgi:hypothetical protein
MIVNFKLCKTKICGIALGGRGACHVAKPYWHIIISFAIIVVLPQTRLLITQKFMGSKIGTRKKSDVRRPIWIKVFFYLLQILIFVVWKKKNPFFPLSFFFQICPLFSQYFPTIFGHQNSPNSRFG